MTGTAAPATEGARQRHLRETRHRIHLAALELAEESGIRPLTIAQIAERAGVSRRTFFRYFANREQAILPGHRRFLDAVAAAHFSAGSLAGALSEVEAMEDRVLAEQGEPELADHRRVSALLASDPLLRAYAASQDVEIGARLTERLSAGLPGLDRSALALLADVAIAAWRQGWMRWSAQLETAGAETPAESHRRTRAALRGITLPDNPEIPAPAA